MDDFHFTQGEQRIVSLAARVDSERYGVEQLS
jgi:hypothetical protein